jgi:hypothetical protein
VLVIAGVCADVARLIWKVHTEALGEANFKIDPSGTGSANPGCGGVVTLALLAVSLGCAAGAWTWVHILPALRNQ